VPPPASSSSADAAPMARSSGLNSEENEGLGYWSPTASTSRSTPVSCSAISVAEAKRRDGSGSVARRSARKNDSCSVSSGTAAGSGSAKQYSALWYPLNSKLSTARERPTEYKSDDGEGPSVAISGAWKPTVP
jgi:hypothetical protein